jgi:hypothetical protein
MALVNPVVGTVSGARLHCWEKIWNVAIWTPPYLHGKLSVWEKGRAAACLDAVRL